MSEIYKNAQPKPIEVGEKLPGLLVHAEERPERVEYWDQVLDSSFGCLYYGPEQYRNGTLRWVTNHGEACIIVESGTGLVLEIDTKYNEKHSGRYARIYDKEMGMRKYQAIKRGLADLYPKDVN